MRLLQQPDEEFVVIGVRGDGRVVSCYGPYGQYAVHHAAEMQQRVYLDLRFEIAPLRSNEQALASMVQTLEMRHSGKPAEG